MSKSLGQGKRRYVWGDVIILLLAIAYITLPLDDVPLHGDEATTIWMSQDYDTVFLRGDVFALVYEAPPRRTTEQHMRIITGNFSKLMMGLAWQRGGLTVDDLNEQWVWGLDIAWNEANGHSPSSELLRLTRLSSAWLMALGGVFLLTLTRTCAQCLGLTHSSAHLAGWMSVALYATHPDLLLNGRRAMFEGGLLFGLTLVAWLMISIFPRTPFSFGAWGRWLIIGLGTGLALSTKHSAAFSVTLLYGGWGMVAVWQSFRSQNTFTLQQGARQRLLGLAITGVLGLVVFGLLHPLWWSAPLKMPAIVIEERQAILDLQVDLYGGYANFPQQVDGLWQMLFRVRPQYYEVPEWGIYSGVSQTIHAYETRGWAGYGWQLDSFRLVLFSAGLGWLVFALCYSIHTQRELSLVLLLWMGGLTLISLLTIPLAWHRYYLPLQVPFLLICGLGAGLLASLITNWLATQRLPRTA